MTKETIIYEARLNKNISRTQYNVKTIYKKGTIIWFCNKKIFKKLNKRNIYQYTGLYIIGRNSFGVYEYFNLEEDIVFVKVKTTIVKTEKETVVFLKDK